MSVLQGGVFAVHVRQLRDMDEEIEFSYVGYRKVNLMIWSVVYSFVFNISVHAVCLLL